MCVFKDRLPAGYTGLSRAETVALLTPLCFLVAPAGHARGPPSALAKFYAQLRGDPRLEGGRKASGEPSNPRMQHQPFPPGTSFLFPNVQRGRAARL